MEQTSNKSKKIIAFLLLLLVIGVICLYSIVATFYKDTHTIDVEKSLKKENFRQENGYIIETLESDCMVLDKFENDKVPTLTIHVTATNNYKVSVEVDKQLFDKIREGDMVHLHREVYYMPTGDRVTTKDIITEKQDYENNGYDPLEPKAEKDEKEI